jgi:hypothetical protein
MEKFKSLFKNKRLVISSLVFFVISAVLITSAVLLNSRSSVIDTNKAAEATSAGTKIVCPANSIDADCNFKGDNGIQQAVDSFTNTSENNIGKIEIRQGQYNLKGENNDIKCHILIYKKYLNISGQGYVSTKLIGNEVETADGICIFGGKTTISALNIEKNTRNGIYLYGKSDVILNGVSLTNNKHSGVYSIQDSQIGAYYSLIQNNGYDGVAFIDKPVIKIFRTEITNNGRAGIQDIMNSANTSNQAPIDPNIIIKNSTISKNKSTGIILANSSKLELQNSIIAFNNLNSTVPGGIGCSTKAQLSIIKNNNVFGNDGSNYGKITTLNTDCDIKDYTGQDGNISKDPKFIETDKIYFNDEKYKTSFYLDKSSPSIDAGDSGILDADSTIVDMGSYVHVQRSFLTAQVECKENDKIVDCGGMQIYAVGRGTDLFTTPTTTPTITTTVRPSNEPLGIQLYPTQQFSSSTAKPLTHPSTNNLEIAATSYPIPNTNKVLTYAGLTRHMCNAVGQCTNTNLNATDTSGTICNVDQADLSKISSVDCRFQFKVVLASTITNTPVTSPTATPNITNTPIKTSGTPKVTNTIAPTSKVTTTASPVTPTVIVTPFPTPPITVASGDLNNDGKIDNLDLKFLLDNYTKKVDAVDLSILLSKYGK